MSDLLRGLLRSVSRSIYLSLRVLPGAVRDPMGLAYLFCRAADSIADTRLVPRTDRRRLLELFRAQFEGAPQEAACRRIVEAIGGTQDHAAERALLRRLPECFSALGELPESDRALIRRVVSDVTDGMLMDFEFFPGESDRELTALPGREELDRYCDRIGGGPGRFWTRLCFDHLASLGRLSKERMLELGTNYGKGLQMTNILRDVPADLRIGRCYMPADGLARVGLEPSDLLRLEAWEKFRPAYLELVALTRSHLNDGLAYLLALPRTQARLRMACAWPLLLARKTLALLEGSPDVLDSRRRIKVLRRDVYKITALSAASVYSKSSLRRLYERLGTPAK